MAAAAHRCAAMDAEAGSLPTFDDNRPPMTETLHDPSSPARPPPGGRVVVRAGWSASRRALVAASAVAERPAAERLLAGRAPAAALQLIPLIYSLCGKAQTSVARAALGAAESGVAVTVDGAAVRREAIAEHLWRLLVDWPVLLGETPDRAGFAQWHRRLAADELPAADRSALGDFAAGRLAEAVDTLVRRLDDRTTVDPQRLPLFTPAGLAAAFGAVDEAFARRPEWQGWPAETGSLARQPAAPASLAGRLRARLADLQDAVVSLESPADPVVGLPLPGGGGIAGCDTARGLLFHRAQLAGDRIVSYRVVAPTEWAFHPESAWIAALDGTAAETPEIAENALRRWVLALDPCVPATMEITTED
jgi:uptake hydrogenase large subunit